MGVDPWECETPEDALASIRAWVKRYSYIHSPPAYLPASSIGYFLCSLLAADYLCAVWKVVVPAPEHLPLLEELYRLKRDEDRQG